MTITITGSNSPTAGGAAYGDGSNLAFTSAGTSGQVLTSAGSSAPTWQSIPASTGGATITSTGSNVTLTSSSNRVQRITTTAVNLSVSLPNATTLTAGGPLFIISNTGTNPFIIKNNSGTILLVLNGGQTTSLFCSSTATSDGTWSFGNNSPDGSTLNNILGVTSSQLDTQAAVVVAIAPLSSTTAIAAYCDTSTTYLFVVTVSGTTLSFGAVTTVADYVSAENRFCLVSFSSTSAALVMRGVGNGNFAVGLSISGTTITAGSITALYNGSNNEIDAVAMSSSTAVCVFPNTTARIQAFTISGTTITPGTEVVVTSSDQSCLSVVKFDSTHGATISAYTGTNTAVVYGRPFTLSGTTITLGTASQISNYAYNIGAGQFKAIATSTTSFIVSYTIFGGSGNTYGTSSIIANGAVKSDYSAMAGSLGNLYVYSASIGSNSNNWARPSMVSQKSNGATVFYMQGSLNTLSINAITVTENTVNSNGISTISLGTSNGLPFVAKAMNAAQLSETTSLLIFVNTDSSSYPYVALIYNPIASV